MTIRKRSDVEYTQWRSVTGLPEPYYDRDGITIYCGDSARLLPLLHDSGVRIDMLATDPPYSSGGAFRGDRTQSVGTKYVRNDAVASRPEYGGDTRDQRGYLAWCSMWISHAYDMAKPGAICSVFTDWRQLPTTTDAVQAGGFVWRGIFAWDKTPSARPRLGGYRSQCEYVVWGSAGPMPTDGVDGLGVWKGSPVRGDRLHQAEKPIDLMHELLRVCPSGGLVLDPFAGSGTTLVAARTLGLRAVGIEADESFCEVAASRLHQRVISWGEPAITAQRSDDTARDDSGSAAGEGEVTP